MLLKCNKIGHNFHRNQIKCKIFLKNYFKLYKISTLYCFYLGSVILHKSSTIAVYTDAHRFGFV